MRKLIFLLALFLAFGIQAQIASYESIVKEHTTHWIELNIMLTPEYTYCKKDSVSLEKDTIINGNKYYVLNNFSDFNNYTSFIKEDTINGKLWFFKSIAPYNGNVNEEVLIMDLSLNINDSFPIPIRAIQNAEIIDTFNVVVDSVYFLNNRKHIRFGNLANDFTHEKLTFIEGVGTNFGFDYAYNTKNRTLISQVKSDSVNYFHDLSEYNKLCSTVGLKLQEEDYFNIYPNPFISEFLLPLNVSANNIQITDLQGKQIAFEQDKNRIRPLDCVSGIYFLSFEIENKVYQFKVVKS